MARRQGVPRWFCRLPADPWAILHRARDHARLPPRRCGRIAGRGVILHPSRAALDVAARLALPASLEQPALRTRPPGRAPGGGWHHRLGDRRSRSPHAEASARRGCRSARPGSRPCRHQSDRSANDRRRCIDPPPPPASGCRKLPAGGGLVIDRCGFFARHHLPHISEVRCGELRERIRLVRFSAGRSRARLSLAHDAATGGRNRHQPGHPRTGLHGRDLHRLSGRRRPGSAARYAWHLPPGLPPGSLLGPAHALCQHSAIGSRFPRRGQPWGAGP